MSCAELPIILTLNYYLPTGTSSSVGLQPIVHHTPSFWAPPHRGAAPTHGKNLEPVPRGTMDPQSREARPGTAKHLKTDPGSLRSG